VVGKGEVELGVWPFPFGTGFTPIIGPFAHLSTTFGWVEGGECSLGGSPRPNDRTGGWGEGDLDLGDRTITGGWCRGPGLEGGASVVGEGGGKSRLAGECSCRGGVGIADLEEPPEDFRRSGLTTFVGVSVLDPEARCLSSLMVVAGGLTRFGFLARSLVGYNAAKQT